MRAARQAAFEPAPKVTLTRTKPKPPTQTEALIELTDMLRVQHLERRSWHDEDAERRERNIAKYGAADEVGKATVNRYLIIRIVIDALILVALVVHFFR